MKPAQLRVRHLLLSFVLFLAVSPGVQAKLDLSEVPPSDPSFRIGILAITDG